MRLSIAVYETEPYVGPRGRQEDRENQMSATNAASDLVSRRPLLDHDAGDASRWRSWIQKLMDVEETKRQILYSLPVILTNVFYYCIPLISVMFAGHLGQLELAGATLANSWATVTGFAFMVGLSGALETLCGQGFGAKKYEMLGIHLQSSCIISFFFSIMISVFWFFTEPMLILLGQDPLISRQAALYMHYQVPGLLAYGFLQNILRFLQTQSIVTPLIVFSSVPMVFHVGIVYVLVYLADLGFKGASLAASISLWISFLSLGTYVIYSEKFKDTWNGFSSESFRYILENLKLSIPSAAMVCLEYWAFEILVILAGLMPNSKITTSLVAMCVNTEAISYMLTYGLSTAASTRVSNELGAGNSETAKRAMFVTIKLSLLLALIVILALALGHNAWAGLFSDSPEIIRAFASLTPFLAVSISIDSVQGVLSGVARGCGWQHFAVLANLAMFYFVGMPVAAVLGFKLKLYAKGLWIGLICGLLCQSTSLLLIILCRNWTQFNLPAQKGKANISESG